MTLLTDISFNKFIRLFQPSTDQIPTRRHDLDWLRVIVFGILIVFHVGMFYVQDWDWHVKSQYTSDVLDRFMLIVEPWRMASLWLISGIAIRFILAKVSILRFITVRSYRLLLPLLFGILVIVPPQLYFEMSVNGHMDLNYVDFYRVFFNFESPLFDQYRYGVWSHYYVNHLWYLQELWKYSLLLVPLLPLLNGNAVTKITHAFFKLPGWLQVVLAVIPLFIIQITVELQQTRYPLGFTFLLYGYLIGWQPSFWQKVKDNRRKLLILAFINGIVFITIYTLVFQGTDASLKEGLVGLFGLFSYSLQRVLGLIALLGYAHHYLTKRSPALSYLSEGVYPFYIVHQTIIIVVGMQLSQYALGPVIEAISLLLFTALGCIVSFEIVRKTPILKPFFGLKQTTPYSATMIRFGYLCASIAVAPLAFQLWV